MQITPTRERLSRYSGGKTPGGKSPLRSEIRRTFEERKSALQQKEKNAQENSTFSHTIPPNGAQSLFPKVSHLTLSPGGGKMRDPGNGVEFKKILMSKWHLIQNQPLLREMCEVPPVISYKRVKSLKDILVQSKL